VETRWQVRSATTGAEATQTAMAEASVGSEEKTGEQTMTEQRTPDELNAENELICEKLLGWTRSKVHGYWFRDHGDHQSGLSVSTPTFNSWYHAGVILDALKAKDCIVSIQFAGNGGYCAVNHVSADDKPMPLAIRAAALEYIRSLP
jgi:hypothetical protein